MIAFEIRDTEANAALNGLAAVLDDLTPVMSQIAETLLASTEERFHTQTAPDGSPWAPRSPVTLLNYARQGKKPGGILHLSGDLGNRLSYSVGPDNVQIGSPLPYAATMQFGAAQGAFGAAMGRTRPSEKRPKSQDYFTPLPWGNIPARPFLGLSDADEAGIIDIVGEFLEAASAGS